MCERISFWTWSRAVAHVYTFFNVREDHTLDAMFPDTGVPAGLNFQDLDESDSVTKLVPVVFQGWLSEGRHNCDLAQAALHV